MLASRVRSNKRFTVSDLTESEQRNEFIQTNISVECLNTEEEKRSFDLNFLSN